MRRTKTKYLLTWVSEMTGLNGKYFDTHHAAVDYAVDIGINFNRNVQNKIICLQVEC